MFDAIRSINGEIIWRSIDHKENKIFITTRDLLNFFHYCDVLKINVNYMVKKLKLEKVRFTNVIMGRVYHINVICFLKIRILIFLIKDKYVYFLIKRKHSYQETVVHLHKVLVLHPVFIFFTAHVWMHLRLIEQKHV